MKLLRLINNKIRCPNRKNEVVDLETCKNCCWFAGRTLPIRKQIYVKCGLPDELIK